MAARKKHSREYTTPPIYERPNQEFWFSDSIAEYCTCLMQHELTLCFQLLEELTNSAFVGLARYIREQDTRQ